MRNRIYRLLTRHQRLDEELRIEQSRPRPDFARLFRLKRLKLAVKDRLVAMTAAPMRGSPA